MSRTHRLRRHRVSLRPKVRRQRFRLLAVGAAIAVLAAAAGLAVRDASRSLPDFRELLARLNPRIDTIEVIGAPESLTGPMVHFLSQPGGGFAARAARLPERFPAVKSVRVRRDWLEHHAGVSVTLRRAVARAQRHGRPAGFLDEDGQVFTAPDLPEAAGLIPVEIEGADAAGLRGLAGALEVLGRAADLPAPVARVLYRSRQEGWEVLLGDGTKVLWGDLEWTREKLARLREALADARSRAPGVFAADLRYFSDGRVLLRRLSGSGL